MTKRPANVVQQISKATRKRSSADEKIRVVLEGLRGQIPISTPRGGGGGGLRGYSLDSAREGSLG
jgi:hypothetical protein